MEENLDALVSRADDAELLFAVDRLCAAREWNQLVDLGLRCREAHETIGQQLWPVADHVDYRLALEGPPAYAAAVLRPGAGRFSLGPLSEVAAANHTWGDLAPYLDDPIVAATVAQERVVRGEDLTGQAPIGELPPRLAPFEPQYALPKYSDRNATFPEPEVATRTLLPFALPHELGVNEQIHDDAAEALTAVAEQWATQSGGSVRAMGAFRPGPEAIVALVEGRDVAIRAEEITTGEALAILQWVGSSGGAHGRRRGGAAGRFNTWWALSALTTVHWWIATEDMDRFVRELDTALKEFRWWRWEPSDAKGGWQFRLAVEDTADHWSWAVEATDYEADPPGLGLGF